MKESAVERHLVTRVSDTGGLVRKIAYIAHRSCPDRLVGWPNGRHGFVETKRPLGKARDDQAREHDRLRRVGFRVDVLDTIAAVDAYVLEMTR
jgi:hypothetical protein